MRQGPIPAPPRHFRGRPRSRTSRHPRARRPSWSHSPADDAGLEGAFASETQAQNADSTPIGGDVLTESDGEAVTGIDQLAEYLANNKQPGDSVELTVVRDGGEITIEATLADWPS